MSYRGEGETNLKARFDDIELRLRRLEESTASPDPGWKLVEVAGGMLYQYQPTQANGPIIGVK